MEGGNEMNKEECILIRRSNILFFGVRELGHFHEPSEVLLQ
jgi:hypothetical protein